MNPNDCTKCEGWTCALCTNKRAGEMADTELAEIDRRVAAAVKSERAEVEKLRAEIKTITEAAGYFPPSQTLAERVAELFEASEELNDHRCATEIYPW